MPILGGAGGAALGSAVGGPMGAAIGGGAGVAAMELAYPANEAAPVSDAVALAAVQQGIPAPGTTASTLHEAKGFIHEIGYWYLLIFVLVPFLSKRGRGWIKKFTELHNTVSQKDIDARDEAQDEVINNIDTENKKTKKEVDLHKQRLDKLESIVKTTQEGASLLIEEN